ncbi:DNA-directed RNA polymeras-like protein III subunit Rpc34 [Lentithecium fluviatile CBS 122367]|uniref:DNA-directed RNA polymerase III subunit RPC6 n=1 Tax=Lentithecium fluviatile CBS 122367 TaxID=1168545 RepID=A0A6G1IGL6_9PLEO|nr:DNA-directed RNA polymeras-like protein III subunit Rpc34 [Lentithecium fluviatile CBS 122367]
MASAAASASAAPAPPNLKHEDGAPLGTRADELYDRCAERPKDTTFFQRDLSNMQVAESMGELLNMVQVLVDRHLLKPMTLDGESCWKLRSRSDAEKLRRLTADERNLYNHIDQMQKEGIWSKALRARTNVTQQVLTKCLKSLESKDLIKSVTSVKNPSRKMYLLKHLEASEDIAGGPWQSNGDFDTGLIQVAAELMVRYVGEQTLTSVPSSWNNYATTDRTAAIAQKKAEVQRLRDIEDAPPARLYRPPMHPGSSHKVYRNNAHYPTAASAAEFLNNLGVLKEKKVRESDMEQLLEMMVLDGRLEKANQTSYRSVLKATDTKVYNGFVDAPCGSCPVFDLCIDEGQISARTCAYFANWLGTESVEI